MRNEIDHLCHVLAKAYISYVIRETGRPAIFVESDRHSTRVTVLMEVESTAVCIRKGLVNVLIADLGQDAGQQTALFLLRASLKDEEVTAHGISIMKSVFLDGVEWQLEAGA